MSPTSTTSWTPRSPRQASLATCWRALPSSSPSLRSGQKRTKMGMAMRHVPGLSHPVLPSDLQPVVRSCFSSGRSSPSASIQACCCINRCLCHGLGSHVQRACSCGALDRAPTAVACQLPRVASSMLALRRFKTLLHDKHVLVRTDNTATVAYINHQGGLRSRHMSQLACHLFLWSQKHLRSLRAVHVPGELNRAADKLSRQPALPGEW